MLKDLFQDLAFHLSCVKAVLESENGHQPSKSNSPSRQIRPKKFSYGSFLRIKNLIPPEWCTAILNGSSCSVVLSLYAQTIASVIRLPRVDSPCRAIKYLVGVQDHLARSEKLHIALPNRLKSRLVQLFFIGQLGGNNGRILRKTLQYSLGLSEMQKRLAWLFLGGRKGHLC